jgi:hypothetical protein
MTRDRYHQRQHADSLPQRQAPQGHVHQMLVIVAMQRAGPWGGHDLHHLLFDRPQKTVLWFDSRPEGGGAGRFGTVHVVLAGERHQRARN